MGWSIGYDSNWERDIGYGVPAICDHPDCNEEIDRGLSHVCGNAPYGGEYGCGLFFCSDHREYKEIIEDGKVLLVEVCDRCMIDAETFDPKEDVAVWVQHKLNDPSWEEWREEDPERHRLLKDYYHMCKVLGD